MEDSTKIAVSVGGAIVIGVSSFLLMDEKAAPLADEVQVLNESNVYINGQNAGCEQDVKINWPKHAKAVEQKISEYQSKKEEASSENVDN